MLEEQRESWGTRGGFILAAIGSAVGLGNLWGFPYKLYTYGGGAFLIPYVAALLLIGIPLMILEFSLGHYTQRAAPAAFARPNKHFEFIGWWGIILGFVIVTYYPVILAYCISFLGYSVLGIFNGGNLPWAGEGLEGVKKAHDFFFETYLGHKDGMALGGIRSNLVLPLVVSWLAMYLCICKGVRLVGKIVWLTVPVPWLMLFILALRGLTLEGSMQGLAYYLEPVWSELAKPTTWRYAFGQVFFSLSLAFGVMVTYASFLHSQSDLNNNAAIISIADFGTSFIAGLAVFATLGGMAYATQRAGSPVPVREVAAGGPSLAFVAFPYALAQLPYSAYFSFIFFFALVTLGIDSAFSITESVLASIVDKTGWRRQTVLPAMTLVGLLAGLLFITRGGLNWLGIVDGFINGTWGIAFLGLLECVVLGWLWRIGVLRRHANSRSDWRIGKWWDYLVRWVIPVILGSLFFWQLLDDLRGGTLLRKPGGGLDLGNCVGLSIVCAAPVLAVLLSILKSPFRQEQLFGPDSLPVRGRRAGAAAFVLAAAGAVLAGGCIAGSFGSAGEAMLWWAAAVAVVSVFLADRLTEKYSYGPKRFSWFIGSAGILGTMTLSCCIAVALAGLSARVSQSAHYERPFKDSLGAVAYVILAAACLLVLGGLGWCFYRALMAAGRDALQQEPEQQ